MSLIESLNQVTQKRAEKPLGEQTEQVRQLVASKSGKAGATSGPVSSNIAESQAVAEADQQATQQAQQGNLAAASQLGRRSQLGQEERMQRAAADQQRQKLLENYAMTVDQNLTKLAQADKKANLDEYKQGLSQAIFVGNLADEKRQFELNQRVSKQNIKDLNQVDLEIQKAIWGNNQELFKDNMEFQSIMNMDEAEFQKMLKQMDLDTAMDIQKRKARGSNTRSLIGGAGTIVESLLTRK